MVNILDYGAVGDGKTLCTQAIQRALDDCEKTGGGDVLLPPGNYVTGTLWLRSNCTLRFENGASLLASGDIAHFQPISRPSGWASFNCFEGFFGYGIYALIIAENVHHAGICGQGVINGRGQPGQLFPNANDPDGKRPFLVVYHQCTKMFLQDVDLVDPCAFAFYALECAGVAIRGVDVHSWGCPNGDGLDFDGSRDVTISDCLLETGDDSISIKSFIQNAPCENYTITNCIFRSMWAGIRLGVESTSDMRNIAVSNCVFENCNDGLKLQTNSGGVYEDLRFSNLVMKNVRRPILMTQNCFRMSVQDPGIRPEGSLLRNITIDGITAVMADNNDEGGGLYRPAIVISGIPSCRVQNVTLQNLNIEFPGGGTEEDAARVLVPEFLDYTEYYIEAPHFRGRLPAAGLYLRHIDGLTMANCRFSTRQADARPLLFAAHVADLALYNVRSYADTSAFLAGADVQDLALNGCVFKGRPVEVFVPDAALEARMAKQLRDAVALEAQMRRWAAAVDAAEAAPVAQALPVESFACEADDAGNACAVMRRKLTVAPGKTWLHLPMFAGNVAVYWNGKLVEALELPKEHRYKFNWAVELTEQITGGEAELMLVWETPGARDGIYDVAFGFDPPGTPNTLLRPALIRTIPA